MLPLWLAFTLASAVPPVSRVAITPAVDTLVVGDSVKVSATAIATNGRAVSPVAVTWGSDTPGVATVAATSTSAVAWLVARGTGTARIDATARGVTGTMRVVVRAKQPPPPPPPPPPVDTTRPPPAGAIALAVQRFDTGATATGPALVTTGVPLRCGALQPGQESTAHVTVAGAEVPLYAAALASRCRDGSARALLVQFRVASLAPGATVPATLAFGGARDSAHTLRAPLARPGSDTARGTAPLGLPQAAALPTSVAYLLATDLVGPTIASDSATKLGGAFARYERDFRQFADTLWSTFGPAWNDGDYYDRALVYTAAWVRTGNPTYWARAQQQAATYRDGYLVPGGYATSPHWALLEGVADHYLLTGDEMSRVAVLTAANRLTNMLPEYYTQQSGDAREMSRFILSALLAWRLTPPGSPPFVLPVSTGWNPVPDWNAYLEWVTGKALAWQTPDGRWPSDGICNGQLNYMVGMLNTSLIKAYEQWKPDTLFVRAVRRSADYLMTTQWRPEANAFQYANVVCTTGSPDPAADLTGFFPDAYGWLYRQTGDAKYRTFGDSAFAASVAGAYLWGQKQFNQQYHTSFRYFGYR